MDANALNQPGIFLHPNRTLEDVLGRNHSQDPKIKQLSLFEQRFVQDFPGFNARHIIPIGKPRTILPGTILLCHKCQHTTKIPLKKIKEHEDERFTWWRFDETIPSTLLCSNNKCGHDLSKCSPNYDCQKAATLTWPIEEAKSARAHGYTNYGKALCCQCHTALPLYNPNMVLHPCWESSEGGYYQETRMGLTPGPVGMMCCKCRGPCRLERKSKSDGDENDEVEYALRCRGDCEHAAKMWNECEDCVRYSTEFPLEDDELDPHQSNQNVEEEDKDFGFWGKILNTILDDWI